MSHPGYNLICMSFDGEYQIERANRRGDRFETKEAAWEHAEDMGSRWYFYPFCFVATDKTIVDTPEQLQQFIGKRINTVSKVFKELSEQPIMQNADVDEFAYVLSITE